MKKLVTKKDFILVLIVLVVGFAGLILVNSADKGKTATIKVDGKVVETLSLNDPWCVPVWYRCDLGVY